MTIVLDIKSLDGEGTDTVTIQVASGVWPGGIHHAARYLNHAIAEWYRFNGANVKVYTQQLIERAPS